MKRSRRKPRAAAIPMPPGVTLRPMADRPEMAALIAAAQRAFERSLPLSFVHEDHIFGLEILPITLGVMVFSEPGDFTPKCAALVGMGEPPELVKA